jgi:AcrR family transcriptional regulator
MTRVALSERSLPSGRHGLSREQVEENQRWRLISAAAQAFLEGGYAQVKSGDIARLAGVSRTTFYQHFENIDACLLGTYEVAADCLVDVVEGGCLAQAEGEWSSRLLSAVEAALSFLAREPAFFRLLGPEAPASVPAIADARQRLLRRLAEKLSTARPRTRAPIPPPDTELLLLDGALATVGATPLRELPGLAPELTHILAKP